MKKKTFTGEDARKTALFIAWNESSLTGATPRVARRYEKIHEGLVVVTRSKSESLDVLLENGKLIRNIKVPPQLSKHICESDTILMALGRFMKKWEILEIFSIGTIIEGPQSGIHFSTNPNLAAHTASGSRTVH